MSGSRLPAGFRIMAGRRALRRCLDGAGRPPQSPREWEQWLTVTRKAMAIWATARAPQHGVVSTSKRPRNPAGKLRDDDQRHRRVTGQADSDRTDNPVGGV
jgi:hypothetical protein